MIGYVHWYRHKLEPYLILHTTIISRCTRTSNMKEKIIQLLEYNLIEYFVTSVETNLLRIKQQK